ncbi:hypothetical protein PF005_g6794 [Phytophthora fragariae]|uniref:M96 mating-specific protein family n=2 Tax=Phytophthora TaxID=4783 RepID=A0A6A3ZYE5_9STRA|nr:hypothetical protein PF003_g28099 [Phytophthora fragariae]KAE9036625.1 hypothetical protein PR002_g6997 [Phytophthora rubi]KAE8942903.1 hypothetical protein PF009_g7369 [Phytophthora fragariae]KAE9018617.1 hypothetical protein PF011_g6177 [Phytophthora fragariae]KAE9041453.1 hypothetical protein PR001_g6618 [Phytophthora rubi]
MQSQDFGVGALGEDLLAALDDVLSLAESAPIADAFAASTDEAPLLLGDYLDDVLSIDVTRDEQVTTDKTTLATNRPSVSRSTSTKSQQTAALASAKKGKDVRTAPYSKTNQPRRRKRPKDELDYLRAKVADMEEELASLQQKPEVGSPAAVSAALIFNGDSADTGVDYSRDVLLCWKKIAERQKKEVNRSVVENLRLRAMLEGQLNVARSLEAAIDQHQREAAQSLPAFGGGSGPQPNVMSDELIFAVLNESLEAQLAEIDTVFELSGIAHVNHDMNNGTKVHHDPSGVSVRHERVRLLPFSYDAVQRTMWGILRYSTAKEMMLGPFTTQVVDDNRMHVTMIEKVQLGSARATDVVRRFAFRRVFEKNRTLVVWSSYVEMDGSVFVRLRETGYCTSSPFNFTNGSESGDASVPGSVTRMVVLASPEMTAFASPEEQKAHVGEMTELVVGTYRVSMGVMHQMIDTLLLREAMGGKVTSPLGGSAVVT